MVVEDTPVVDVWMQHPTEEFQNHEMFAPLRRWTGDDDVPEIPLEWTVQAYENAGVGQAIVSAWWGPEGPLLSNDHVADVVAERPDLFAGLGSVPLDRRRQGGPPVRRGPRVRRHPCRPVALGPPTGRPPLLPRVRRVRRPGRPVLPAGRPHRPAAALRTRPADPLSRQRGPGVPRPLHRRRPHRASLDRGDARARHEVRERPRRHLRLQPKRYPDAFVEFLRTYGSDDVMFGTNYPMLQPGDCLDGVADLDLDEDTRRAFLHGNAERVFDIEV